MTKQETKKVSLIPSESIASKIYLIRNKKVMLDSDLAKLYRVTTSNLNKAVRRNIQRFPKDFMFRLTASEYSSLRFQIGILEKGKHSKYLPFVFTEQGIAMLSSILNSETAIEVNIQIIRTFTKLREMLASNELLRNRIEKLENQFAMNIKDQDAKFKIIFDTIKKMLTVDEPPKPKRKIGFHTV
jgi:phage regulator Rha-like protein